MVVFFSAIFCVCEGTVAYSVSRRDDWSAHGWRRRVLREYYREVDRRYNHTV